MLAGQKITYVRNEEQPFIIYFGNHSYEKGYRTWLECYVQYPVHCLISTLFFANWNSTYQCHNNCLRYCPWLRLVYYMTSLDLEEYRIERIYPQY